MDLQAILDAITANPALAEGIVQAPAVATIIQNKVKVGVDDKIADEVAKTHSRYDEDIFAILGKRPADDGKGAKQKTYDFNKQLLTDYKRLLDMESELGKDEAIIKLKADFDKLKLEGGGKYTQEILDQAKKQWEEKELEYQTQIETLGKTQTETLVKQEIATALLGIKFNPDVTDSIKNIVLKQAEENLLKNSKVENGKVVFLNAEGKPIVNGSTAAPQTAVEVLTAMEGIKDITLKDKSAHQGGDVTITGSIKTVNVNGKDSKSLDIPAGSFKTKTEFSTVSEKLLTEAGFTKRDKEWTELQNAAYVEHKVGELPQN